MNKIMEQIVKEKINRYISDCIKNPLFRPQKKVKYFKIKKLMNNVFKTKFVLFEEKEEKNRKVIIGVPAIPFRQKICDFCKEDMEGKSLPVEGEHSIDTFIDDIFLYEYCECGRRTVKEINYCPMCGRKLKEDT